MKHFVTLVFTLIVFNLNSLGQVCLQGWGHRVEVIIDNSTKPAETDFPLIFAVDAQEWVDAGIAKADLSDLRIQDDSGSLLRFNMYDSYFNNTGDALIYIEIPFLPSGRKSIYVYTDNPTAIDADDDTYQTLIDFDLQLPNVSAEPGVLLPKSVNLTGNNDYCLGGTLSLSASMVGTGTFSWTGPNGFTSTNENISINNLTTTEQGIYSINATSDLSGCILNSTVNVRVFQPTQAGSITASQTLCQGTNTGALQISGYLATDLQWQTKLPTETVWTDLSNTTPNYNFSVSQSTDFRVKLRNGACDEVFSAVSSIFIDSNYKADFTFEDKCLGEIANFNNTTVSVNPNFTNTWDFGDGNSSTAISPSHTYVNPGNYTVVLTTETIDGCKSSATKIINISQPPIIDFNLTDVCPNEAFTLTPIISSSTAGLKYEWTVQGQLSSDNRIANYLIREPNNYIVSLTVTNSDGCSSFVSKTQVIKPVPEPSFSESGNCDGQTVSFTNLTDETSLAIASYSWDFGDLTTSTQKDPTHIYSAPGNYLIRLTANAVGGCSKTFQKAIFIERNPISTFSNDGNCANSPILFTPDEMNDQVDTYQWNIGTTNPDGTMTYTASDAENITVELTVIDKKGCSSTTVRNIQIQAFSNLSINRTINCQREPSNFSVGFLAPSTGLPSNTNYTWDFGDGITGTGATIDHTYLNSGNFEVTLSAESATGCRVERKTMITVRPTPSVDFSADVQCILNPVQFTNSITFPGVDPLIYLWNFGDGNNSTLENPSHQYTSAGQKVVTLTVSSSNGCTETQSKIIEVFEPIQANFEIQNTCAKQALIIQNNSKNIYTDKIQWFWDFGNGDTSDQKEPSYIYNQSGVFDVTLTATHEGACFSKITKTVAVFETPEIQTIDPISIELGQNVEIFPTITGDYDQIRWIDEDGNELSTTKDYSVLPLDSQTIILEVENKEKCKVTQAVKINVNKGFVLKVNNVITINGNDRNDRWVIDYIEQYETAKVLVFNRWGQVVYENESYQNDWDGQFNGQFLPEGTYSYFISFSDSEKVYKGSLMILKSR